MMRPGQRSNGGMLRGFLLVLLTSLNLVPDTGAQTAQTAAEVLRMPSQSGAQNARLAIVGHVTVAGITIPLKGEGLMAFGAKPAMTVKVVLRISGEEQLVEEVAVDGISYSRTGSAPWHQDLDVRINQPDRWRQARAVAMLPSDRLSLGDAWHVVAMSPQGHQFEAWVRQRDGYPLRFALRDPDSLLVIDYRDFNRGAVIIGPIL
jgi:hypothetical protein